ncbi:MAG: hypothetical protein B6226_02595 [Candidatus Cloacimonetes bacterium 4572_65]|nr:MAG: hypothetical protein B6226_02595 [Candidatus Cloacimonetes bacterium 4572_65]
MKKYIIIFICLLISLQIVAKSFYVEEFKSDIFIQEDGSLKVEESFLYKLEGGPFNWIKRDVGNNNSSFIVFDNALINGVVAPFGGGPGEVSVRRTKRLDVKLQLDKLYDTDVKFELAYSVYNAFETNKSKAILTWIPTLKSYNFLIKKGEVSVHYPESIQQKDVVNFYKERDNLTIYEEDNLVKYKFKNYDGESFKLVMHFPREKMNIVNYQLPQHLERGIVYTSPKMKKFGQFYKYILIGALLYLLYMIHVLVMKAVKTSNELTNVDTLPNSLHPALIARIIQIGANDINLIPVLMQMAIKKIISFEQMVDKKGKLKKDYWINLEGDVKAETELDVAYYALLLKEQARISKRLELKALVQNSYRHKKELLKLLNNKFDALGYIDKDKKRKHTWTVVAFLVLFILTFATTIVGFKLFSIGNLYFPIVPVIMGISWLTMFRYLDEKVMLTLVGKQEWLNWISYKKYLDSVLRKGKGELNHNRAEAVFPYILLLGYGQVYLKYFKKKNIELDFPNLGAVADDIEALNTLVSIVVITTASAGGVATGGGAAGGGGGGGAG